jgi:beta-glucosidase
MELNRSGFGSEFSWGVSTAAYQIEGAHDADGKGPSIWDRFVQIPKKVHSRHSGNITCNYYNHFEDDIRLLGELCIPNYRFSISWSRVLPMGAGQVNQKGIDFYSRIIDQCIAQNITPWITLYHWDLPEALQVKGGWTNRDIIEWFSFFVSLCVKNFGDRVKHWMVLNEPIVFTGAGYFLGVHAPGKRGLSNFMSSAHHAAICQAEGGRIIKELLPQAKVGTTFSYSHIEPYRLNNKDISAAKRTDALLNRMFIEPLLGLGYPIKDLKVLNRIEKYMKAGDESRLAFDMDFIGLQNYTREIVTHSHFVPFIGARILKAEKRNVKRTEMGWEVYPQAIYHALMRIGEYKKIKEIIVTENGAAFHDIMQEGKVNDSERILFLKEHIAQVLRARQQGVAVNGYFVWTFLDNFEWAEGFRPRFGLIHIDYATQKRTVKASGYWYRSFLKTLPHD